MTLAVPLGTTPEDTVNILMQKGFLQMTAASVPGGRLVKVGRSWVVPEDKG